MLPKLPYPAYQHASGWNALLDPRQSASPTRLKNSYPFVVIGAGYTGVAAARRLAELYPDQEILLLEAGTIGTGSSARNSGFMISMPHNTHMSGNRSNAVNATQKQIDLYQAGLTWLQELTRNYAIKCGWQAVGKYHGAATRQGIQQLRSTVIGLRACGVTVQELDQQAMHAKLGTHYYQYGYHTSHNVLVQPAALIRGLADNLPANVILCEQSPVLDINPVSRGIQIQLAQQTLQADKLILSNNGFVKKLGYLNDRLITIYTYAGLTPTLSPEEMALHGDETDWGLIPAHRLGTTLRKYNNERFMLRSAYSYEQEQPMSTIRSMLTHYYQRRYPLLRSHEFEYVWGGVTALTRNGSSYFGRVDQRIYAVAGCNGSGLLKGSIYGKLIAEMVADQPSTLLSAALSLPQPSWLPPEPLRRLSVSTAIQYQRWQAGAEA